MDATKPPVLILSSLPGATELHLSLHDSLVGLGEPRLLSRGK